MSTKDYKIESTLSNIVFVDFFFRAYISPVIAVLGIFGNVVAVVVFCRNRDNRFAIYSAVLATVNIFILFFNTLLDDFLGRGIYYASNGRIMIKIDVMSPFSCRLMGYVPNVMYCVSSYILVALSIDRCMVLTKPLKYTANDGIKGSLVICFGIIILSMLFNLPIFITYNVIHNPEYNNTLDTILSPEFECMLPNSTLSQLGLYWKSVFTFAIPTAFVICLNAFVIFTITNHRSPYHSAIIRGITSRSEQSRFIGHLAVSCLFTVLFLPLSIIIVMRLKNTSVETSPSYSLLKALSKLLSSVKDLSYASNILLYLLFMPHFRYRAKQIFSCSDSQQRESYKLQNFSFNRPRSSLINEIHNQP